MGKGKLTKELWKMPRQEPIVSDDVLRENVCGLSVRVAQLQREMLGQEGLETITLMEG